MKKEYIGIKEAAQEASKYQGRVAIVFDQSDKKSVGRLLPGRE